MKHSSQLIVLNTTKTGENSLVLHALTPEFGRRSFIMTVPKQGRMALLQAMNILDGEIVENPKSDLWRISSLSASHPLNGLRSSFSKNSMAMFMSEVLYRSVTGNPGSEFFDWCRSSILTLDALESDFSNFHLMFLLELSSMLGFCPDTASVAPFAGNRMPEIAKLLTLDKSRAMLLPLGGQKRDEIAEALLGYLGSHCEINLNIRSLNVLRELFR